MTFDRQGVALAFVVSIQLTLIGQDAPLMGRVDALVATLRAQQEIPGLSLAIVVDGTVVHAKGFGSASITDVTPVTPETQYRTASVTKAFTATAVLQLAQDGKLALARPAREYCSELKLLEGAPTVRHLLAHQSGLRHTTDAEDTSIRGAFPRLGPALRELAKERLQFPPGTKALYTSWGYAALGCVIEGVTGQSYADVIRARIFEPAQLSGSAFDSPAFTSPQFSPGFRLQRGKLASSEVVDTRFKLPASGLISTVNDLVRFASALFDGTLLSPQLFQEMLTVPSFPSGELSRFTLGWIVSQPALGSPAYFYAGSMEGSTAYLLIVPERRVAVALLTNRERFVPQIHPLVIEATRAVLNPRLSKGMMVNRHAATQPAMPRRRASTRQSPARTPAVFWRLSSGRRQRWPSSDPPAA